MTKIISIISKGHSGSTLCDILIGSIPGVFSTGECVYFPWQLSRNGGMCKLGQDFCSCGAKFSECNIWSKVIASISRQVDFDILETPYRFPMAMYKNQIYRQPLTKVDRVMRGILNRMLQYSPPPTPLMRIFTNHVDKQLTNNWLFFDTIAEVTGNSHIVDSSKDIIRTKLLHQIRPGAVSIILLIRDIEGVAASAAKRKKDPIEEARNWGKQYRQYYRLLGKIKNLGLKIVRYEDLAAKPDTVRQEIAGFLNLPLPEGSLAINTRDYHLVAGNPMRYKGEISISYDDSWRNVLTNEEKKKIRAMMLEYQPFIKGLVALEKRK